MNNFCGLGSKKTKRRNNVHEDLVGFLLVFFGYMAFSVTLFEFSKLVSDTKNKLTETALVERAVLVRSTVSLIL